MFGPQLDTPGCCNAVLVIGDDYGDNEATMKCQKKPGHEGPHEERYRDPSHPGEIIVTWEGDERERKVI